MSGSLEPSAYWSIVFTWSLLLLACIAVTNPLVAVETAVCVCFFFSLFLSFLSSFQCCICCGKVLHYFFLFLFRQSRQKGWDQQAIKDGTRENGMWQNHPVSCKFLPPTVHEKCDSDFVCVCMCVRACVFCVYAYTFMYACVCSCNMSVGYVTVVCLGLYSCERLFYI